MNETSAKVFKNWLIGTIKAGYKTSYGKNQLIDFIERQYSEYLEAVMRKYEEKEVDNE
jgi:hypothetical protein